MALVAALAERQGQKMAPYEPPAVEADRWLHDFQFDASQRQPELRGALSDEIRTMTSNEKILLDMFDDDNSSLRLIRRHIELN